MLRNEEFKSIILKLILLQLMFAIIGFLIVNVFIDSINEKIIERDMALVGNIIKHYPEVEDEIISYITKEVTENDKLIGKEVLKSYGYHEKLDKIFQPILKDTNMEISMALLIFFFIIPLGYIIRAEYKKIYTKVQDVYNVAEKVVEGDFKVYLPERKSVV